ncbi:expressed unknown protein [Seminavis robusta]|uniref:Uncharacterized protein n=1 Tax=Seminavis robusta TaxID=568900 RepID=A0A9N8HGK7_9STRA|nr:expressed unknown protein [Seminavis robusta]|eukprot:Sro642_g180120.1 n/a (332) ;mRNA; f:10827-11822
MIIIWGRTTRKSLRPDSAAILGSNPRCPMRGCDGRCQLFNITRYCHAYWIPLFPQGEPRQIVQCRQCHALFDLSEYQSFQKAALDVAARNVLQAMANAKAGESTLTDLLRRNQFTAAETQARAMLKKDPMNINMMCHLNVALNGLGRTQEADKLESQIVFQWQNHCRAKWIASGRPKGVSAFPRVMMNQATSEYRLEAKQFFEPEKISDDTVALYKILAHPRNDGPNEPFLAPDKRLFKLVKSGKSFVLSEITATGSTTDVISYMAEQPDIRKVTADVASFLGGGGDAGMPLATAEAIPEVASAEPTKGETMAEMTPLTAVCETKSIPEVV